MMLSIFKGYADTMPVAVSLDEVVRLIREDKVLADHTEKYRYYRSQETEGRHQWLDGSLDGGL